MRVKRSRFVICMPWVVAQFLGWRPAGIARDIGLCGQTTSHPCTESSLLFAELVWANRLIICKTTKNLEVG